MSSGLKVLKVQTDKGLKTITGDHRMIDMIVEAHEETKGEDIAEVC